MAKDDMPVLMYKILRYLYECMKNDKEAELEEFAWESKMLSVPQSYWCEVIATLVKRGYIEGFKVIDGTKDAPPHTTPYTATAASCCIMARLRGRRLTTSSTSTAHTIKWA